MAHAMPGTVHLFKENTKKEQPPYFCGTILNMNIFPSALKHGITPEQSVYVVEHALKIYELDNDPLKLLYLGADDKGTLLEVIVTQTKYGHTIIHSMKMRTQYKKLLNTKRR